MKYMALVLAIAVVALLVPFPLAHKQVDACSLGDRCRVIVAQADCRDLCMQRLAECRAVKGPNCQAEFAVCTSSCR